jgi:Cys-tRNA(Pro) deacylase
MSEANAHALAPAHLVEFLRKAGIPATSIAPGVPMPTVPSAAAAIGVDERQILKTLLFCAKDGRCIIAVACGTKRVDRQRLAEVSGIAGLRVAPPDQVFSATGYPAGGVAPVGFATQVPVVVDEAVLELPISYGGGGHESLLLQIDPAQIVRVNNARVALITVQEE